jgi:hypothetical protein
MRSGPILIGAMALVGAVWSAPGRAVAQAKAKDPVALRKAQDEAAKLQEQLSRTNAEIAQLKRSDRSVRDDYRLRDRMADAEAIAQKLTRVEARLRALEETAIPEQPRERPLLAPPQASPQDGSIELEAKADLFADQASALVRQAEILTKAATELRMRKSLRRRAGAWDRDPFAGLESSRRSLALSQPTPKMPPPGPDPRGGGTETPGAGGPSSPPSGATGATSDSAGKSAAASGAPESPASKSSPLAVGMPLDHQTDQRLFLDPAVAAELRLALGAASSADPDALDRAAAMLRTRARSLGQQAEALRSRSRAP